MSTTLTPQTTNVLCIRTWSHEPVSINTLLIVSAEPQRSHASSRVFVAQFARLHATGLSGASYFATHSSSRMILMPAPESCDTALTTKSLKVQCDQALGAQEGASVITLYGHKGKAC